MIEFTLKEGDSYGVPWVVAKVNTVEEAIKYVDDPRLPELLQKVSSLSKTFRLGRYPTPAPAPANGSPSSSGTPGAKPIQQPAPGPHNPMPEGMAYTPMGEQKLPESITLKCPECQNEAPYREGVSDKGTPYSGNYCLNRECSNYWKPVKA